MVKYPQNGAAASYLEEPPGVASTRGEDSLTCRGEDSLTCQFSSRFAPRYDAVSMAGASLDGVIQVAEFRTALRRLLRQNERVAAHHGLTPQRYLLLLMIKGAPDGSQRSTVMELTERLQLAQHTVTELVGRAERMGLIRREWSSSDRRIAYLRLTTKGEHKFAASFRDLDADRQSLRTLVAAIGPLDPPRQAK